MIKICKLSLYDCKDINELSNEEDMAAPVACTSTLQLWHKTGRGDNIKPQPVMEVVVKKTKLDTIQSTREEGVKCLLYETRKAYKSQTNDEIRLKAELEKINPRMGLAQVMIPGADNYRETKFGKSPIGSYASYQLQFTESNFTVYCNIDAIPRLDCNLRRDVPVTDIYPAFPLQQTNHFHKPANLEDKQEALLNHLIVDEVKLNKIEEKNPGTGSFQRMER